MVISLSVLNIIVVSPTVRTNVHFTVRSVVGGMGRFDVLARCLLNLSRWVGRLTYSINFIVYFSHPKEQKYLEIHLSDLFASSSDFSVTNELESTLLLQQIFSDFKHPCAVFKTEPFATLINDMSKSSLLIYLTPRGLPLNKLSSLIHSSDSLSIVLGSQADLSVDEERILHNNGAIQLSLGSYDYLSSHCITIICNELAQIIQAF